MPRFADIQSQDRAHELLRFAAARNRLPHAYLFHGTKGVGKTSTAFALAQFLNCEAPTETDSCGDCRSCRRLARLAHPDLHWIFPMAGSEGGKRLKGDQRAKHIQEKINERLSPGIHGLSFPRAASIAIGRDEDTRVGSVGELRREAGLMPIEARLKVFVVTEAERMTAEAANSLLKVLEEPPPQNLLILTTHRPRLLLDTIVSRCQHIRFADLSEETLFDLLMERTVWKFEKTDGKKKKEWVRAAPEPTEARLAAALARGSATRAADLVEEGKGVVEDRDRALALLALSRGDPELYSEIDKLARAANRAEVGRVLDFGMLWLGDLLRARTGTSVPLANRDREEEVRSEAAGVPVEEIRRRAEVLARARRAMEGNAYMPLVLHEMMLELSRDETLSRS
jgi:DNA polymerase-3 subunit delta'